VLVPDFYDPTLNPLYRDVLAHRRTHSRRPGLARLRMASRPRLRPNSMASRNGSQALADGIRLGFSTSRPVDSTPNPVVTALAGFEVAFAFPFEERFSGLGLGLIVWVGFVASDPVVTWFSLAGFAGGRRPHATGGRTAIWAAFR
jgi:hypothetical protein